MKIRYNQASAGSGKTHSIETELCHKLATGEVNPTEVIAVTFTRKAADELRSRIVTHLLGAGETELATQMMDSKTNTIHSVFGQLVGDFAFELGLAPSIRVIDDQDKMHLLDEALESSLSVSQTSKINDLATRLSVESWQSDVLNLIEEGRVNNLDGSLLDKCSKDAIQRLKTLLPTPDPLINENAFRSALLQAIDDAKLVSEPTKGLKKIISESEQILNQDQLPWQSWVKVSKFNPTKCGEIAFAIAQDLGRNILRCQDFQDELFSFIETIYYTAKFAMKSFAELKARRGLIDFVDQENLAYQALCMPNVSAQIEKKIKLLIVDEFQDTSPLQLALISKLSEVVDDVLLVGDAKQAIYGFRGSDPRLTLDVLNYVENNGGIVTTLPYSWRSRPGLVHLSNDIFTQPFSHLLKPDQVNLSPKQAYALDSAEVEWWKIEGSNKDKRLRSLANEVRQHYERGIPVWDKKQNESRKMRWQDMALLCRSNDEAAAIAEAFVSFGIPTALERTGIVETAEATLALACLRRLVDHNDSLASAEILSFMEAHNASNWLEDRIEAVNNGSSKDWNKSSHPVLSSLDAVKKDVRQLTPREALLLAIQASDLESLIVRWSEDVKLTDHRLANIKKLVELATDYENHCCSSHKSATVSGYILWLRDLEQSFSDFQASKNGNAVTVCTYHKSKGLEWPVVICTSLDATVKCSLYGVQAKKSPNTFDWNNPLQGRSVNYWPNPFPDQRGNDPLSEVMVDTDEWKEANQLAINEAIQLLYVGFTRARDQLILTESGKQAVGSWLALLDFPLFPFTSETSTLTLPCGQNISTHVRLCSEPVALPPPSTKRVRHWLNRRHLYSGDTIKYHASPSSAQKSDKARTRIVHRFGQRIRLNGSPDMDVVGNTLHHVLALYIANAGIDEQVIESLIRANLPGTIDTAEVSTTAGAFLNWIHKEYPGAEIHAEMPFSFMTNENQLCSGRLDLAIELDDGWIIVDHKSNPQPEPKWEEIALEYSGQLNSYAKALETLSTKPVLRKLIFLPVAGGLIEVETDISLAAIEAKVGEFHE